MKRLFVAIELDSGFKDYIYDIQGAVIKHSEKGKFHPKDNLHLTIEFIGVVPEKLINPMWQSIINRLSGVQTFTFRASGLGYFQKKNKKIPWVEVEAPAILNKIQEETAKGVAEVIEHVIDHSYTPHITLGRQVLIETLPKLNINYAYQVNEICLMESSSASGSLKYTPIKRYKLEKNAIVL
jgi:2'-5' RNA ligase